MAAPSEMFALYRALVSAWNRQDVAGFAACFTADGALTGSDGVEARGRGAVERHLPEVISSTGMGSLVYALQDIRLLSNEAGLLIAAVGVMPSGNTKIDPARVYVQMMLARRAEAKWKAVRFQTTPAEFASLEEASDMATQLQHTALDQVAADGAWTVEIDIGPN